MATAVPEIKLTFGMIVLNGEPFLRYNLQALYPFAHEIIVVEGACPSASPHSTPDGHSLDGTLETLREFKTRSDPEGKLTIVTAEMDGHPDGFWNEKDEMSQAYARRATGNYLWQVDADEFYQPEDMQRVSELLQADPEIKAVAFRVRTFWGGLGYRTDGIALRREAQDFHRLFAWRPTYRYISHRPPTVVDEHGRNLRTYKTLAASELALRGIYLYHYSFLFPFQVRFKLTYYSPLGAKRFVPRRQAWAENFFSLQDPFMIDDTSVLGEPSWLRRFTGQHPAAIQALWSAVDSGTIRVELRPTADIERLLAKTVYRAAGMLLPIFWTPFEWARLVAKWARARRLAGGLRRLALGLLLLPDLIGSRVRLALLSSPVTSTWAARRWIQKPNAAVAGPARRAQFSRWSPKDLLPKLAWHGRAGWRALEPELDLGISPHTPDVEAGLGTALLAGRRFFETQSAEAGQRRLIEALRSLAPGGCLLVYAPHSFAFANQDGFAWIPGWKELDELVKPIPSRVIDFNPGFDRNGFFHFIVERLRADYRLAEAIGDLAPARSAIGQIHHFYLKVGGSRLLSHSAQVLSAAGLNAVRAVFGRGQDHHFFDRVPDDVTLQAGDLAMGHYGSWLIPARERGALTILYGPGDRMRAERHDDPFYDQLQVGGSFHEQYTAAHMAIFQAGGLWRTIDPWKYAGLCRWIDLPVSSAVFPWTRREIAPPGQRVFCFINLYNSEAKGGAIARQLAVRCPDLQFVAIGCKEPFRLPNVKEYGRVNSRSGRYRRLVTQADFLVTPARDDPQPGTVAECCSMGLLPILSEYAGYVLSFPQRLDVDDLEQCAATLRAAQNADPEDVAGWQALNAHYVEDFHRQGSFDRLQRHYLAEAIVEFDRVRNGEATRQPAG